MQKKIRLIGGEHDGWVYEIDFSDKEQAEIPHAHVSVGYKPTGKFAEDGAEYYELDSVRTISASGASVEIDVAACENCEFVWRYKSSMAIKGVYLVCRNQASQWVGRVVEPNWMRDCFSKKTGQPVLQELGRKE